MSATKTPTRRKSKLMDDDMAPMTCGPLGHPLRVRILEITNERDISPSMFVDEGLEPKGITFTSRAHGISHTSYHFRELEKAGCVEVVQTFKRRGAIESIYRGCNSVEFTTEEFAKLPKKQRRMLSRTAMQALVARVDGAMMADTFDSRVDRFMVMMPLELDRRGWGEFINLLDHCFAEVKRINDDADDRLAGSGGEVIPTTYGMLGFPSPEPPPLPDSDSDE
jgi:hypothetical protein